MIFFSTIKLWHLSFQTFFRSELSILRKLASHCSNCLDVRPTPCESRYNAERNKTKRGGSGCEATWANNFSSKIWDLVRSCVWGKKNWGGWIDKFLISHWGNTKCLISLYSFQSLSAELEEKKQSHFYHQFILKCWYPLKLYFRY